MEFLLKIILNIFNFGNKLINITPCLVRVEFNLWENILIKHIHGNKFPRAIINSQVFPSVFSYRGLIAFFFASMILK